MSEGTVVLRVLNEGSAEISNIFYNLVTEVEGTQTAAIFGVTVSIEFIVSLVSELEKKHSAAFERTNTC